MNIIVIVSDTLRKDHLGCYGNRKIKTPNLDKFAKRCIQFTNAYTASFPTMPNRADLFTGKYTFSYLGWDPLPREEKTLADILREAGYTTIGVVDTPFFIREGYGYDRGFEDFEWIPSQARSWPKQRLRVHRERRYEEDQYVAKTITCAEKRLESYYKEPFFLYIDTWDPHEPWDPPYWYIEPYYPNYTGQVIEPCYGNWRECGLKKEEVEIAHACYCGKVTMVDFWIGHFLNKIECMGLLDNTIVTFISDHGFYFGEHGYFGKLVSDEDENWRYSPLYEEITRIPLLIYIPGLEPKKSDAYVQPPDLMPTLLDLLGVNSPESISGKSFISVLKGEEETFRDLVVTSPPLYNPGEIAKMVDQLERDVRDPLPTTITVPGWTFLYSVEDCPSELYNMDKDPQQSTNILDSNFEIAKTIHHRFIEFLKKINTKKEDLEIRKSIKRI